MFRRAWGLIALLAIAVAGQIWQAPWSNPMNSTLPYWLPLFLVGIGSSFIAEIYERDQKLSLKVHAMVVFGMLVLAVFLIKSLLAMLIWVIVFPISLGAWRAFAPRAGRLISAGLCHPAAQWLGNLSYSLYLLHWPLIIALLGFLHRYQPAMSQSLVLVFMMTVGLAVILLFSWVLHCVIEKPFMALGRYLVNHRATAKPLPMMPATR
jgi:peptidoglycan/LPS O-acetylase OafA/YrhL